MSQETCPIQEVAAICVVEDITPALAEEYLKLVNINTRPSKKKHVAGMGKDMATMKWRLNGETVIFGKSGQLLEGKQRLLACIASGTSFRTFVVRGVEDDVFDTLDDGARRSGSDLVHMMGLDKAIAPAATLLAVYSDGRIDSTRLQAGVNKTEIRAVVTQYGRELTDALQFVKRVDALSVLSPKYAVFCYLVFARQDKPKADQFFNALASGANLAADNPILHLRKRLLEKKRGHNAADVIAPMFKCWVYYRDGKSLGRLQIGPNDDMWSIAVANKTESAA